MTANPRIISSRSPRNVVLHVAAATEPLEDRIQAELDAGLGPPGDHPGTVPRPKVNTAPSVALAVGLDVSRAATIAEAIELAAGRRADGDPLPRPAKARKYAAGQPDGKEKVDLVDLTISFHNSLSIARENSATRAGAAMLDTAALGACDDALDFFQREVGFIRQQSGGIRQETPAETTYLRFLQRTARALSGQPADGDWHAHHLIPNIGVTAEGKPGALHLARLKGRVKVIGAMADVRLATRLRTIGVKVSMDPKTLAARIDAVPAALSDAMAKRRNAAVADAKAYAAKQHAAGTGKPWDDMEDHERARLVKGGAKRTSPLFARDGMANRLAWQSEAAAHGFPRQDVANPAKPLPTHSEAVQTARAFVVAEKLLGAALEKNQVLTAPEVRVLATRAFIPHGLTNPEQVDRVAVLFKERGVRIGGVRTPIVWGRDPAKGGAAFVTTAAHADGLIPDNPPTTAPARPEVRPLMARAQAVHRGTIQNRLAFQQVRQQAALAGTPQPSIRRAVQIASAKRKLRPSLTAAAARMGKLVAAGARKLTPRQRMTLRRKIQIGMLLTAGATVAGYGPVMVAAWTAYAVAKPALWGIGKLPNGTLVDSAKAAVAAIKAGTPTVAALRTAFVAARARRAAIAAAAPPKPAAAPAAGPPPPQNRITPGQVVAVQGALRILAGKDTDGATQQNGAGFNRDDSKRGHELAGKPGLTDAEAMEGRRMVRKYWNQIGGPAALAAMGAKPLDRPVPATAAAPAPVALPARNPTELTDKARAAAAAVRQPKPPNMGLVAAMARTKAANQASQAPAATPAVPKQDPEAAKLARQAAWKERDRLEMLEIKAGLSDRMREWTEKLLGPPRKVNGHELEYPESVGVAVSGPDRGSWYKFSSGDGGGPLDLYKWKRGGGFVEAKREAKAFLGMPDKPVALSPAEEAKRAARIADMEARDRARTVADAAAKVERQEGVSRKAKSEWATAEWAPKNHPYLAEKQIDPMGLKVDRHNNLLVPGRDMDGKLWHVQRIAPDGGAAWRAAGFKVDGNKMFAAGAKTEGTFFMVGKPDPTKPVAFAEGVATGKSVAKISQLPVAVTFSVGNKAVVMNEWRARNPTQVLIDAVDNDHGKPMQTPPKPNAGVEMAVRLESEVGSRKAVPLFAPGAAGKDWNDKLREVGLSKARAQFQQSHNAGTAPASKESPKANSRPTV